MAQDQTRQQERDTRARQTGCTRTESTPSQRPGSGRRASGSEPDANRESPEIRQGFMVAYQAQAAPVALSTPVDPPVDPNPHRRQAAAKVEVYRKSTGLALEEQRGGDIVYPNPLN